MSSITDTRESIFDDFANNDFVFSAIVTRYTKTGYDASTGTKTQSSTSNEGYLLFKKISEAKSIPKYFELREGDKAGLFAGNGFEPNNNDIIAVDNNNYKIKLVIDYSAGSKALFFIIMR